MGKRTENKKESGSEISTEKEDKGNKNKTNKRTLKKGKRKITEIYLCAVCNKSITSASIPCKACLNYVHLSRCTNFKDVKDAKAHGEFYRCPNCVKNDISIQITPEDKTEKRKPGRPRIQTSPGVIRRTSLSDLTRKRKKTEYEGLPNKLSPLNKRNRIQRKETQDKNKLEEKQEDQTKSIENNVETKKNESYNELTFEDGMLRKEDVNSLNDGKCLTDATISFAFAQIEKEKKKELEENNIKLVRPEVAMVLKRGDKSQVLETKRAMRQNGEKIFMTPINDSTNLDKYGSGEHYSVLFIDTTSKVFMHLDSIEGKNTAHAKEMAISMLDEDSFDEKGKLEWTFTEDTTCGKQDNGFDCGVYVIHNVKAAIENICHAKKFERNNPTTEEITNLRRELKQQVYTEMKRQSQKNEKMETAVNKINKHIESNNKSESPTEKEQKESSKGCPNCEKNNKEKKIMKVKHQKI